jgi:hypothetical protein
MRVLSAFLTTTVAIYRGIQAKNTNTSPIMPLSCFFKIRCIHCCRDSDDSLMSPGCFFVSFGSGSAPEFRCQHCRIGTVRIWQFCHFVGSKSSFILSFDHILSESAFFQSCAQIPSGAPYLIRRAKSHPMRQILSVCTVFCIVTAQIPSERANSIRARKFHPSAQIPSVG